MNGTIRGKSVASGRWSALREAARRRSPAPPQRKETDTLRAKCGNAVWNLSLTNPIGLSGHGRFRTPCSGLLNQQTALRYVHCRERIHAGADNGA